MTQPIKGDGTVKKSIWLKVALCFASFDMFSDSVVVPIVTAIYNEFPNSSFFQQNFVLSGSALLSIPAALITGIFTRFVSKRYLVIFGSLLYCIGGIGGAFSTGMDFLLATRAITGVSNGILSTVALSLI